MRIKHQRLAAVLAGAMALAGVTVTIGAGVAAAAQPDPASSTGTVTLSPASGTSSTTFNVSFGSTQYCPGDSAANYKVQTYITPRSENPAAAVFGSTAPSGAAFTAYLKNTSGTVIKNVNPGLVDGQISLTELSNLTFTSATYASLAAGQYWIGVACSLNDGSTVETAKFWRTPLTIKSSSGSGTNNFTYETGFTPDAPTIDSLTSGDGQISVAFTPASVVAGASAATSYTVVVKDATCTTQLNTFSNAASPIVATGLTNGTAYCFTVQGTNGVGAGPLSATSSGTPNPAPRNGVASLVATPLVESVKVDWTAPSDFTPNSYTLEVLDGAVQVGASPYTGLTGLTYTVTGLTTIKPYTFKVTPVYTGTPVGGGSFTAASVSTTATPFSNQIRVTDITVTRPAGFLKIYQKCGTYGSVGNFTATSSFPGYPFSVSGGSAVAGGDPFMSPTDAHCSISMGTATLVRDADAAALGGSFYAAAGRLGQVTVLDTTDTDTGWRLSGAASNFTSTTESFSGNYLGWSNVAAVDAPALSYTVNGSTATYDQTVTAAADILPGTGVGGGTGLADGQTLASAAAGAGLGEAQVDARLLLLIPVQANAGTYTGTFTLTLVQLI